MRWLLALVAVAWCWFSGPAAASGTAHQQVAPDNGCDAGCDAAYAALGIEPDELAANYVVLVDTSGSMLVGDLNTAIRKNLRDLIIAMSPADTLSIFAFDETARNIYRGQPRSPDAVLGRLPIKPRPGKGTDIGAAIETAVDELDRRGAAQIAAVVLLTDGKHAPPPKSNYPQATGPGWRQLRTRTNDLRRADLRAYAVPLRGSSGAALLRTVFPERTTDVDATTPAELATYLAQPRNETRAAKAAQILDRDTNRRVEVEWQSSLSGLDLTAGSAEVAVTLRSRAEHLPLRVSELSVRATGLRGAAAARLPATVQLAPGKQHPLRFQLYWNKPRGGFLPVKRSKRSDGALALTGRVTAELPRALQRDGVRVKQPAGLADTTAPLRGSSTVGSWPLLLVAAGAFLLLALPAGSAGYVWLAKHPPLRGHLVARTELTGEPRPLPLSGRHTRINRGPPLHLDGTGVVRSRQVKQPDGRRTLAVEVEYGTPGPGQEAGRERRLVRPGEELLVRGVLFQFDDRDHKRGA
jgi:hypothetical protein